VSPHAGSPASSGQIGVLAIVPVAGAATGFALSMTLAALQYGTWTKVAFVSGIFIFGQTVEANLLTPKLVGNRIHLLAQHLWRVRARKR
jgi:predicted PurR-regulated permease PerM